MTTLPGLEHIGDGGKALLARARAQYEIGRKSVAGRPPWARLNPNDPYDMGMRRVALKLAAREILTSLMECHQVAWQAATVEATPQSFSIDDHQQYAAALAWLLQDASGELSVAA